MSPSSFVVRKPWNLFVAGGAALAFAVIAPAFADSQAGPLYVYDSADPYAIEGSTTSNNGIGVEGYAALASLTGVTGVLGYTSSPSSTGVSGYSDGSGQTYGVYGYSTNGNGVYGKSSSGAASIYGANANGGTAISGYATALALLGTSMGSNGVVGSTQTGATQSSWAGIVGHDNSTAGAHYGVAGKSASNNGYGVYGISTGLPNANGSNSGIGVVGETLASGGTANFSGVYGLSIGTGDGVVGVAGSSNYANGVFGTNNRSRNGFTAVIGQTSSGYGAEGIATGTQGYGIYATSRFSDLTYLNGGVFATSEDTTSTALRLYAYDGLLIQSGFMSLDANGNMLLRGALTQTGTPRSVVRNAQGVARFVYELQQAQPTLEDLGGGQIIAGYAYVRFDPAFADLLDRSASYQVFLTPKGPTAKPLYVTQKSAAGFAVREASGQATLAFDYRVVARPASAHRFSRLTLYHDPLAVRREDRPLHVPQLAGPNRDILTRDITLGPPPRRLKAPFVPKPRQRR